MTLALLSILGIVGAMVAIGAWTVAQRNVVRRGIARGWWQRLSAIPDNGVARVVGRGDALDLAESPLYRRRCLVWVVDVVARDRAFKKLGSLAGGSPFRVVDDSGVALVDPAGATLLPGDRATHSVETRAAWLTAEQRRVVARVFDPDDLDPEEHVIIVEACIEPGHLLAIEGRLIREPAPGIPARNYREAPPLRMRIVAPDGGALRIVGQDGGGADTGLTR